MKTGLCLLLLLLLGSLGCKNKDDGSPATPVSPSTPVAPPTPDAPTLHHSASENQLNWTTDSKLSYTLEIKGFCKPSSSWSIVDGATSPHTLAAGDNGYFRLKACLDADCSEWSNVVELKPAKPDGADFYGGDGSTDNPFLIGDYDGLKTITDDKTKDYHLIADIDASPSAGEAGGKGFEPIGDAAAKFTGALDGCGHKITELTINRPAIDYVGLFGYADGAGIRNLGLEDVDIDGKEYTGSLAGRIEGTGTIHRVYATGDVAGSSSSSASSAGGLVGRMDGTGSISQSFTATPVSSNSTNQVANSGGLVGWNTSSGSITASYATGNIQAAGNLDNASCASGGLVGLMDSVSITASFATGNVSSSNTGSSLSFAASGGLVGLGLASRASIRITASYATGTPTASDATLNEAGGLIGFGGNTVTTNTYAKVANGGEAGITIQAGNWIRDSLDEKAVLHWNQEDPDDDGTWTDLAEPIWGRLGEPNVFPCLLGVTPGCK